MTGGTTILIIYNYIICITKEFMRKKESSLTLPQPKISSLKIERLKCQGKYYVGKLKNGVKI